MAETRYSKSHEWARREDDGTISCGITQHAADELNEMTFLEFRVSAGDVLTVEQVFGEIETVKSTSELFAPVAGEVVAINERFTSEDELGAIHASAEGDSWLIKIQPSDEAHFDALMDKAAYSAFSAS